MDGNIISIVNNRPSLGMKTWDSEELLDERHVKRCGAMPQLRQGTLGSPGSLAHRQQVNLACIGKIVPWV